MSFAITPGENDVMAALCGFVQDVLGLPAEKVLKGLGNRAAMPLPLPGFVVITPILGDRLETNIHTYDRTALAPTALSVQENSEMTVQLDCYGPSSNDWARVLSMLWRDEYAINSLAPSCSPLHADQPRMVPLIDSEAQYEQRWALNAVVQYNPIATVPQDFADSLSVQLVEVNSKFPP